MNDIRRRLLWLVLLICGLALLSAFAVIQEPGGGFGYFNARPHDTSKPPPYTGEIAEKLRDSHGFQVLISYTNNGFESNDVHIKKGDTVRFTNNSSNSMHISSPGRDNDAKYPSSDCKTMLDSCGDIAPRDFWEFTATELGTWTYKDSLRAGRIGVIRVE